MAEAFLEAKSRALRINGMIRQEINSLITDKTSIIILFVIPLTLITVLGFSTPRTDQFATTIWIIDEDNTTTSAQFITSMQNTTIEGDLISELAPPMVVYSNGELAPIEPNLGEENATSIVSKELAIKTLPTKYLDAFIVIPKGYQDSFVENSSAKLVIYYDAIDLQTRLVVEGLVQLGLTQIQLDNMMFERDVFYFPDSRPGNLLELNILDMAAPFFLPLMLFFSMQLVTTQSIVGDIPLKRMLNTSLRRGEAVTGKLISYTIVGIFQILLTMIFLKLFNVTMHCLWIDLFLVLFFNSLAGISIGIFMSSISKTRLQASQLFLLVFFIMIVLQYFVRKPFFLVFNVLEQGKIAYSNLAYRGMILWDPKVRPHLFNTIIISVIFYILSVIYIKFIKKEFV